jgi:hypothetical protein
MHFIRHIWTRHGLIIKILIALAILGIIGLRLDWTHMAQLASNIRPEFFVLSLLFMAAQVFLLSVRWKYLMNAETELVSYKNALNMTVASQTANFMFVTSVGGVLLRLLLARHYGLSILKSVCAVAVDRIMTLSALLLFALLFLPILAKLLPTEIYDYSLIFFGLGIPVGIIGGLILLKFLLPFIRRREHLYSSLLYLGQILKKPNVAAPVLISSVVAQGCFFIACYMAAEAIGIDPDILSFFSLLPFISLVASLPIGFGGWGIREGAFVVALQLIGITDESAFMISVQVGILSILGTIGVAIPLLFTNDFQNVIRLSGRLSKQEEMSQ